jgi:hypothetical protein
MTLVAAAQQLCIGKCDIQTSLVRLSPSIDLSWLGTCGLTSSMATPAGAERLGPQHVEPRGGIGQDARFYP